jgi:hypothetical protein
LSLSLFSRGLREKGMSEILFLVVILAVWLLLQVYILPKLGIST